MPKPIEGRLTALRNAIQERDWDRVEFHFDNVVRGVARLVGGDPRALADERWEPMELASKVELSDEAVAHLRARGANDALIDEMHAPIWKNNHYTVNVSSNPETGHVVELSIRRNDRQAVHDWRHFQRIKSEIAGPNVEAVEIYPAESRLMDTANQYYLFCFPPGMTIPMGYAGARLLADAGEQLALGAQQRPLPEDWFSTQEAVQAMLEAEEEAKQPSVCPECESTKLSWDVATRKLNEIADGRLGMHDVSVDLVLGCDECSATVCVVDANSAEGMALLGRI